MSIKFDKLVSPSSLTEYGIDPPPHQLDVSLRSIGAGFALTLRLFRLYSFWMKGQQKTPYSAG